MFLMGVIAGAILMTASGATGFSLKGKTNNAARDLPTPTPTAQQSSSAPEVSVQERMMAIAKEIGVNEQKFKECIESDKYKQKIADEEAGGAQAGVTGTPGTILYNVKTKNGVVISGAQPIASFKKYVDAMIKNPSYKVVAGDQGAQQAQNVIAVDTATEHIRGNKNAQLAIIEYSDYQCPFCHRVHPTEKQLVADYGDKVMWVFRHFPLSFHPDAEPFAIGAECASEIGGNDAFWTFTDKVMEGA